ncbi:SemiSWEET family sugar transporter [Spongiimicrobium salis]|uniref:SemiSWEET family sugar transporter n=1 Tax=Spongiimicrobium salis TaxID=1667022 RepID=UPI00374D23E2
MEYIEILGLVAATLTTAAFVPQVYKVWKEKSTKDISLTMYCVLLLGLLLWLIYGIYHQSIAIILANAVTAFLVTIVLLLKLKYK